MNGNQFIKNKTLVEKQCFNKYFVSPFELDTFQGQEIQKRKNLQRIMTLQIKP